MSTPRHPVGVVGLGAAGERSKHRTTPERCAELGHPGATYNTFHNVTACLCGKRWQEGDKAVPHIACCGGPLTEALTPT